MFKLFSNILTLLIAGVTFVCPVALRGKDQFYITMAIDKVLKDLIMSWVTTLHSQLIFSWIYNHGYRSQPFVLVEKKKSLKEKLSGFILSVAVFFLNLNNLIWTYHHTTFEYEFSTHAVFWLAFFFSKRTKKYPMTTKPDLRISQYFMIETSLLNQLVCIWPYCHRKICTITNQNTWSII